MSKENESTIPVIVSHLKSKLDRWIDSCEIAKGHMCEIEHLNESEHFEAQRIAYNNVKDFLEENGF